MRVVIIGGGLAGLIVADRLARADLAEIILLESRDFVGGRIRSVYSCDDCKSRRLLYESGPWRIPDSHTNMIGLCKELGLNLDSVQTPTPRHFTLPRAHEPGMSVWEAYALQKANPAKADMIDLASGYADETAGADMTYATTREETYKTVREGFSEIPLRLKRRVKERGVQILLNHRTADLARTSSGKYNVTCVKRTSDDAFTTTQHDADAVFVCVPPHVCKDWSALREHASPVLHAVMSNPLNHIYVHGTHVKGIHERRGSSLLAQSISTQYPENGMIPPYEVDDRFTTGWYQISYSAGRVARFWYNLFINNSRRFYRLIFTEAGKISDVGDERRFFDENNVKMHFWEHAVHTWRPTPNFDVDQAVAKARQPHPYRLPGLFLAGEAFSKEQAWMEGALTTAHAAVTEFLNGAHPNPVIRRNALHRSNGHIAIDGRVIDVSSWARVHPGGEAAIRNHLRDRDIHSLFKHIGHSSNAWAVVFGLQVGFLSDDVG